MTKFQWDATVVAVDESGAVDGEEVREQQEISEPRARSEALLVEAAKRWLCEALDGRANDDDAKVALLAPISLELLGKATLWRINPVLLVPLNDRQERSLYLLATRPDLSLPDVSTISLQVLMRRLANAVGILPLNQEQQRRLVDIRNGAVHAGTAAAARDVLIDCLTLMVLLLKHLGHDKESFFGAHTQTVEALIGQHQSQISQRVSAKLASARARLKGLAEQLGDAVFTTTAAALASQRLTLNAGDYRYEGGVDADCPACGFKARLVGKLDVRGEADFDVEPLGEGRYESIVHGYWQPELLPLALICTVCQLHLDGPEELAEAGLPSQPYDVSSEELGADFDIQPLIDAAVDDYEL